MLQKEMTITSDVAGQLLTKTYRKEKIFGKPDPVNPLKAPGSVCHGLSAGSVLWSTAMPWSELDR